MLKTRKKTQNRSKRALHRTDLKQSVKTLL
jgi:hypothetical protein